MTAGRQPHDGVDRALQAVGAVAALQIEHGGVVVVQKAVIMVVVANLLPLDDHAMGRIIHEDIHFNVHAADGGLSREWYNGVYVLNEGTCGCVREPGSLTLPFEMGWGRWGVCVAKKKQTPHQNGLARICVYVLPPNRHTAPPHRRTAATIERRKPEQ
jgi:hypothetical protein